MRIHTEFVAFFMAFRVLGDLNEVEELFTEYCIFDSSFLLRRHPVDLFFDIHVAAVILHANSDLEFRDHNNFQEELATILDHYHL